MIVFELVSLLRAVTEFEGSGPEKDCSKGFGSESSKCAPIAPSKLKLPPREIGSEEERTCRPITAHYNVPTKRLVSLNLIWLRFPLS